MKTIALVAGERSGDLLGGELLRGISSELPGTRYLGIGGEAMRAQGLAGVYPMERLAVMGLVEVAGRLRELLRQRRELARRLIADPRTCSSASTRRITTSGSNGASGRPVSR